MAIRGMRQARLGAQPCSHRPQAARNRPPRNGVLCLSGHSKAEDIGGVAWAAVSEAELGESSTYRGNLTGIWQLVCDRFS